MYVWMSLGSTYLSGKDGALIGWATQPRSHWLSGRLTVITQPAARLARQERNRGEKVMFFSGAFDHVRIRVEM